jgi:hypothetical protein
MSDCSSLSDCVSLYPMKLFLIGRFLTILALAGLMLAPIGSAVAMPSTSSHAMADKMDCCPEQHSKAPNCAKTCPFVALCMTGLSGLLVTEAVTFDVRDFVGLRLLPASDFELASLEGEPPSRPPRV